MKGRDRQYWGMRPDGRRYVIGHGPECVDCGEFIDTAKKKGPLNTELLCSVCMSNRAEAITILQSALMTVGRDMASMSARIYLRHATAYLRDSTDYYEEVFIGEVKKSLKQEATIRHIQQQREAGATVIAVGF